jgi:hypothetical protein
MTPTPISLRTSPEAAVSAGRVGIRTTLRANRTESVLASNPQRRISPLDGRALEILGHAIEYLADEFALRAGNLTPLSAEDPQISSIQKLMAASRSVYYDCPIVPSIRERLRGYLFRREITAAS